MGVWSGHLDGRNTNDAAWRQTTRSAGGHAQAHAGSRAMTPVQDFSCRRAESAAITGSAGAALGEAAAEGAARRVILCIEDDSECAALIKEELKERGFEVAVAHNGRAGLSMLQEMKIDLVLADVNMPEMSGFEVLERLNEISADLAKVPFIFVTGLSDYESEIAGRTLGADDYVKKPIDFDILQTIIDARLAGVARLRLGRGTGDTMSEREIEALTWVARGKTRDEIAEIMCIAKRTVEFHIDNAQSKLGVQSRVEAAVKATILGLIDP
jgi:DNA-binding NarL/FixJ family response regulator